MKENDEIYYIIEEEDSEESALNFAAYENEERDTKEEDKSGKKRSPLRYLLQIMFNPVQGWKNLRRSKISIENLQSKLFYPLLSIMAISNFAEFFYSVNVSLSQVLTDSVVSFVSLFFGYFSIPIVLSWLLTKDVTKKFEEEFGKEYILVSLSTLALFKTIINILPMLWPILIFLPIWTLYLMFKGVRFFKFQTQEEMKFFVICGATTIGIPLLIDFTLNAVLPY